MNPPRLSSKARRRLRDAWPYAVLTGPAMLFALDAWRGALGPNPLERSIRDPGYWALLLLLVVLAVTPLRHLLVQIARARGVRWGRRMADWNAMIRMRRPLGLASFFYAILHLGAYASLDVGWDATQFSEDLRDKPFILAGLTALALLLPLAITSTDGWMRRLKRNWKRLHQLVYPAGILAVLHFVWLSKPGTTRPLGYAAVLALLLGYRLVLRWHARGSEPGPIDDIAPQRGAQPVIESKATQPT